MPNVYLYFSGTGNTRFAIKYFAKRFENKNKYELHSIEEETDFEQIIKDASTIIIGYPIYGSTIPQIMKDFLKRHLQAFQNKNIMTLITQVEFSGDGGALAYYILKKANVKILASMHVNMPYNAVDFKLYQIKTAEESESKYEKAVLQIDNYVRKINSGAKVKIGRRWYSHFLGLFFQRMYFMTFFNKIKKMVKINHETCIKCNKCVNECPMDNLIMRDGKIETNNNCTICYRCVNICPTKSVKIFGRKYPSKQYYKK